MDANWAMIATGTVATFGTVIVSMIGRSSKKVSEINDAVNHKHEKGDGRGIFDYVISMARDLGEVKVHVQDVKEVAGETKGHVEEIKQRAEQNTARIAAIEEHLRQDAQ